MASGSLIGGRWNPAASLLSPSPSLALTATFAHNKRLANEKDAKAARIAKNAADELAAQNEAADAANLQISTLQRRRRLSSLFAGGRSVLGAPAGHGAPAGGGSPSSSTVLAGGGAGGAPRSYAGPTSGPSRSYGGTSRV